MIFRRAMTKRSATRISSRFTNSSAAANPPSPWNENHGTSTSPRRRNCARRAAAARFSRRLSPGDGRSAPGARAGTDYRFERRGPRPQSDRRFCLARPPRPICDCRQPPPPSEVREGTASQPPTPGGAALARGQAVSRRLVGAGLPTTPLSATEGLLRKRGCRDEPHRASARRSRHLGVRWLATALVWPITVGCENGRPGGTAFLARPKRWQATALQDALSIPGLSIQGLVLRPRRRYAPRRPQRIVSRFC